MVIRHNECILEKYLLSCILKIAFKTCQSPDMSSKHTSTQPVIAYLQFLLISKFFKKRYLELVYFVRCFKILRWFKNKRKATKVLINLKPKMQIIITNLLIAKYECLKLLIFNKPFLPIRINSAKSNCFKYALVIVN